MPLFQVKDLSQQLPDGTAIFSHVNFTLNIDTRKPEILALQGESGGLRSLFTCVRGRSTLLT